MSREQITKEIILGLFAPRNIRTFLPPETSSILGISATVVSNTSSESRSSWRSSENSSWSRSENRSSWSSIQSGDSGNNNTNINRNYYNSQPSYLPSPPAWLEQQMPTRGEMTLTISAKTPEEVDSYFEAQEALNSPALTRVSKCTRPEENYALNPEVVRRTGKFREIVAEEEIAELQNASEVAVLEGRGKGVEMGLHRPVKREGGRLWKFCRQFLKR
ncbi:hypothetical protein RUND412_001382 [Rhizina undulata]